MTTTSPPNPPAPPPPPPGGVQLTADQRIRMAACADASRVIAGLLESGEYARTGPLEEAVLDVAAPIAEWITTGLRPARRR
jgi:hypothetical protein